MQKKTLVKGVRRNNDTHAVLAFVSLNWALEMPIQQEEVHRTQKARHPEKPLWSLNVGLRGGRKWPLRAEVDSKDGEPLSLTCSACWISRASPRWARCSRDPITTGCTNPFSHIQHHKHLLVMHSAWGRGIGSYPEREGQIGMGSGRGSIPLCQPKGAQEELPWPEDQVPILHVLSFFSLC